MDALGLGLQRKDAAAALLADGSPTTGLLGSLSALLRVEPGLETAIAAALGTVADAVAVDGLDSAAIVPKTNELLPEPETPVTTVRRRFGISTLTSLRLF